MSEKKLYKILLNSDALFLTLNKGDALNNTIPGKFQTYLPFGKPLISNSIGAVNDIIRKTNIGYTNSPGDNRTLLQNLFKIKKMTLYEKKNIYKRSYLLYLKYFELQKNINNLNTIFKKCINN